MKIGPFDITLRRSNDGALSTWPFSGWSLGLGGTTASGVTVTTETPITHETVYSCLNVIAEGVAMLALVPYQVTDKGRKPAVDHPLYDVLVHSPTPHLSAFAFWRLVIFEKLHRGNHYSLIRRDDRGGVVELRPIEHGRVQPFWYIDPDGCERRAYRVSLPAGGLRIFLEDEIFHVANLPPLRGPSYTLLGASVWDLYLAEVVGGAMATNEFARRSFANGASLSGMISVDKPLEKKEAEVMRELASEAYSGVKNSGKIGVFGNNAKFSEISQDNEKSQLLQTRQFDRSVIAGILRVSAHLINDLSKATFSNIEHLDIAHYKHCLLPHLIDLRQTVRKDLLLPGERQTLVLDHDLTELLRGDQKSYAEVMEKAVMCARMTPDEVRAMTGLPPMPGGDRLYINSACVPLDVAGAAAPGAATAPAPAPQPEAPDAPPAP